MSALKKRRYFAPYITIPFVVAIVLAIVIQLFALQRSEMIAELANQVSHRNSMEASVAVRQLAAMPRPPLRILVAAASSSDPEVSQEAQQAISKLLRQLQRQIETKKSKSSSARQLIDLARSLNEQKGKFAENDRAWLSKTATKVLRLANQLPEKYSPDVALHCDAVLTAIAGTQTADVDTVEPVEVEELTSVSPELSAEQAPGEETIGPQPVKVTEQLPATMKPVETVEAGGPHERSVSSNAAGDITPLAPGPETKTPMTPPWVHPVFRMVPPAPIHPRTQSQPQLESPKTLPIPPTKDPNNDFEPISRPMAKSETKVLLQEWLRAEDTNRVSIEQELAHRGFKRLSPHMVEELFSNDVKTRMRLVDDVLTEPGVDARPWLMMLAEDEEADVRLLALTIMATSNDPALIERAWEVAIHDRDPRVSALVDRLRERRNGAVRR